MLFHAILCAKGMTTYDYVLANQAHGAESSLDRLLACLTCSRCGGGGGRVSISPCQALLTSARHAAEARKKRRARLVHPDRHEAATRGQVDVAHTQRDPEAAAAQGQSCSGAGAAVELAVSPVHSTGPNALPSADRHVEQAETGQPMDEPGSQDAVHSAACSVRPHATP